MRDARAVHYEHNDLTFHAAFVDKNAYTQSEYERICYGESNVDPC